MDLTGLGGAANFAKSIVDRFFPPDATPGEKMEAEKALTAAVANRDTAKSNIMVAEMQQSDLYTKRARPTLVYAGLLMIFINYVLFPFVARMVGAFSDTMTVEVAKTLTAPLALPTEFWAAWGGVCSVWVLGRSVEKRGVSATSNLGKVVGLITGNKGLSASELL
jgi:hypothetical protein